MTISQLEYVVAVDTYKNFVQAAQKCFVTQPTLSMQVQKLEENLGVKIFDRSKQPVVCTEVGETVVAQARIVLAEAKKIQQLVKEQSGKVLGTLQLGIIPTLAPYLLPMFLNSFLKEYPEVELHVQELTTEEIIHRLKKGLLDAGMMATPLGDGSLSETPLFHEPFMGYVSRKNPHYKQAKLTVGEIEAQEAWILNEGHCFRSQVLGLCKQKQNTTNGFHYESGSLETLKKLVEMGDGMTILPALAIREMAVERKDMLRDFEAPVPVRQISIVIHRQFLKKKLIDALKASVLESLPEELKNRQDEYVVPI
jgi:LysR family transcriptional regulator, hydrogen peroxide-inducible genes activator